MNDKIEKMLYRQMPNFILEIMRKYLRMEVEGIEYLPKRGSGIITPNHSGYTGMDAMIIMHEVQRATRRIPKVLSHHFWFLSKATSLPAQKIGLIEATTKNGLDQLAKGRLIILFPEGEYGNFKPTSKAYELQEFKRGFVRMAIMQGAPIIPTMVIGAEETHINLNQLKLTKLLRGLVIPVPLNLIPLPARWKIRFLRPIYLPYKASAAKDSQLVREIAEDVQYQIQEAINTELKQRKSVYL